MPKFGFLLGCTMASLVAQLGLARADDAPAQFTITAPKTVLVPGQGASDSTTDPDTGKFVAPATDWNAAAKAEGVPTGHDTASFLSPLKDAPPPSLSAADRDSYFNTSEYQHLLDRSTHGHASGGAQVKGAAGAVAGEIVVKGVSALIGAGGE